MRYANRLGRKCALILVVALTLVVALNHQQAAALDDGFVNLAIDVDTTGNSANGLGATDECMQKAEGDVFQIDIVARDIPAGPYTQGLGLFFFNLRFNRDAVRILEADSNFLLTATGSSTLIQYTDADADSGESFDEFPAMTGHIHIDAADLSHNFESGDGVLARFTVEATGSGISALVVEHANLSSGFASYGIGSVPRAAIGVGMPCAVPPLPTPIGLVAIDADPTGNGARAVGPVDVVCRSVDVGDIFNVDVVVPDPGIPSDTGISDLVVGVGTGFGSNYPVYLEAVDFDANMLLASAPGSILDTSDTTITPAHSVKAVIRDYGRPRAVEPAGTSEAGPGVLMRVTIRAVALGAQELGVSASPVDQFGQRIPVESGLAPLIIVGSPCPQITDQPDPAPIGATAVFLDGEPGTFGPDREVTYREPDVGIAMSQGPQLRSLSFEISGADLPFNIDIYLSASPGHALTPGSYVSVGWEDAYLDIDPMAVCNASFTVHEIVYTSAGILETFAASLNSDCEWGRFFGEIRYNSTFPLVAATVSPTDIEFTETPVGNTSETMTARIENAGTEPLQLGEASLAGPHYDEFSITEDSCSGIELPPSDACQISTRFEPHGTEQYLREADVVIPDSTRRGERDVSVTGMGLVAVGDVVRLADFYSAPIGSTGQPVPFIVFSDGGAALNIEAITVTGEHASDFAITTDDCTGLSVPGSGRCLFWVTFTPSAHGPRNAALVLDWNAFPSRHVIPVTADGLTRADISVEMRAVHDTIHEGHDAKYVLTVRNHGPDIAFDVMFQHFLPTGTKVRKVDPAKTDCQFEDRVYDPLLVCRLGNMQSGDQVQIRIRVTSNLPAGTTLFSYSHAWAPYSYDLPLANNRASSVVTITD